MPNHQRIALGQGKVVSAPHLLEVRVALCFIAIVGLVVLVWVVFALVALALITGG